MPVGCPARSRKPQGGLLVSIAMMTRPRRTMSSIVWAWVDADAKAMIAAEETAASARGSRLRRVMGCPTRGEGRLQAEPSLAIGVGSHGRDTDMADLQFLFELAAQERERPAHREVHQRDGAEDERGLEGDGVDLLADAS